MDNSKENLREQIDYIDSQISLLLQKRFECVKQIGQFKKQYGLVVKDEKRELKVLENVTKNFQDESEKEAVKHIYSVIIEECVKAQK